MSIKPGDVYYSHRSDIKPAKTKYQLYFDDETVLLINTKKSKLNISVYVTKAECPILDYDSYICIDRIFKREKQSKIIKIHELSSDTLNRIKSMIGNGMLLTNRQIDFIKTKISAILATRE